MTMQSLIESKLGSNLSVHHLEVTNESDSHNVPPGSESHFKVVVVADEFEGKSLIARHQMVYGALSDEMAKIHALALHTYSPADWPKTDTQLQQSPDCRGGSKGK